MQASANANEMTTGSDGRKHGGLIEPMQMMSKDAQRMHTVPKGSEVAERQGPKVAQEADSSQDVKPGNVCSGNVKGQML